MALETGASLNLWLQMKIRIIYIMILTGNSILISMITKLIFFVRKGSAVCANDISSPSSLPFHPTLSIKVTFVPYVGVHPLNCYREQSDLGASMIKSQCFKDA